MSPSARGPEPFRGVLSCPGEPERVKADPGTRRRVILTLALLAAALALLVWSLAGELEQVRATTLTDPAAAAAMLRSIIRRAALLHALFSSVVCCVLGAGALRTWRQNRFPPQGMKVLRDTPVRRGRAAQFAALSLGALALLLLASNTVFWFLERLLGNFLQK